MFGLPASKLKQEIATIAICSRFNTEFRQLRFVASATPNPHQDCPYERIDVPGRAEWAVYDHCASIMRLYAVYERFVGDLATAWLEVVPSLFSGYSNLPETLRKQHVLGVARVLARVGEGRYKHLTAESVVEGLYRGRKSREEYELLYELFAVTERNLRLDALAELFSRVGVADLKTWLAHHREIQSFMLNVYGGQETVDSKLNELVSYRNEAGHGEDIGQILGLKELLDLATFVEVLCDALAECTLHRVCRQQLACCSATVLGEVTEVFEGPRAVVAVLNAGTVSVGQEFVVIDNFSCKHAKVLSLELNDIPVQSERITAPTEVGIKFDLLPTKGSRVVLMQPTPDLFTGADI
jgi:hypothetical protein